MVFHIAQSLGNFAAGGNASSTPIVCYASTMMSTNGILENENPLTYTFPLFLIQLIIILLTNRITTAVLRPLRMPSYISEIVGGFIIGPTLMGRFPAFADTFFPFRSMIVLESLASIGLIFYMFIIGIEVEPEAVHRVGRRSIFLTAVCLVGPVMVSLLAGFVLHKRIQDGKNRGAFITFLCSVFSVTAFSLLANILAELKQIASEVGSLALASAMIADGLAWVLLMFSIALSQSKGYALSALWAVFSGGVFSFVVYMAVRRAAIWVQKMTPEGEEVAELHVCVILVGVMVAAFAADAIGTHAIFGAFVYGMAVPNGPLGELLIQKTGDFIEGLLLPLFFAVSGFRTNLHRIVNSGAAVALLFVVLAAAIVKIAAAVLAAFHMKMSLSDGISLGLLMNTKGVIELIILNIGWDKMILGEQSFTIMVVLSVMLTALVTPLVNIVVKPSRRFVAYKRRTIMWWNPESELRVLVCTHSSREVPSLISLIDISHPTKRSPFFVYALHLTELTGRASTLFVINTASSVESRRSNAGSVGFIRQQTQSEQIANAFEFYEQHAGGVSVQSLTAFSAYPSMHEDVIAVSEDKHCALILLPFHKHQSIDGAMEVTHPAIRSLNQNVLAGASCSVGILINRSLGDSQRHTVALLFFGGADDREALAYADRLATHPGVALTIVRFLPCIGVSRSPVRDSVVDLAGENDEECLAHIQAQADSGEVEYRERKVSNAEETVDLLREMEGHYDLYIVGRGDERTSPLTEGLMEWSECPELGPIGDLLASADFGSRSSVLVLRRGKYGGDNLGSMVRPITSSPGRQGQAFAGSGEHRQKRKGTPLQK